MVEWKWLIHNFTDHLYFIHKLTIYVGNEESKSLPLTKSLQLITYTGFSADGTNDHDSDEEVHGLIFIYREFEVIYVIEQELAANKVDRQAQVEALEGFKNMIC